MSNPSIDRSTYMTDSRFEKLREQGITYETFKNNESYYKRQLSVTSIHDLYNKGKENYNKYTDLYLEANNVFLQLKYEQEKNRAKYNQILQGYVNNLNGDESQLTSSMKSSAARESGYTTELIRNTNNAEIMADVYLDQRRAAVNMQRMGLMTSVFQQSDIT